MSKNIAHSVRMRLDNVAKKLGRPIQEVYHYYAMERFLYRLARSPHAGIFVLKGALLFRAWGGSRARSTRDIDLLALMDNSVNAVVPVFREVCQLDVEPDGMIFDSATLVGTVIKEEADYPGVRIRFGASLHSARLPMQVDIGFADVVTPGPVIIRYPTFLDLPTPQLAGYTPETVVAEKFDAMVRLGQLNSRMKDFYDLWVLARRFDFDGPTLSEAISKTFENRKTVFVAAPFALTPAFAAAVGKDAQWKGFIRKAKLDDAPTELATVVAEIGLFLLPVATAVAHGVVLVERWKAPGPWKKGRAS